MMKFIPNKTLLLLLTLKSVKSILHERYLTSFDNIRRIAEDQVARRNNAQPEFLILNNYLKGHHHDTLSRSAVPLFRMATLPRGKKIQNIEDKRQEHREKHQTSFGKIRKLSEDILKSRQTTVFNSNEMKSYQNFRMSEPPQSTKLVQIPQLSTNEPNEHLINDRKMKKIQTYNYFICGFFALLGILSIVAGGKYFGFISCLAIMITVGSLFLNFLLHNHLQWAWWDDKDLSFKGAASSVLSILFSAIFGLFSLKYRTFGFLLFCFLTGFLIGELVCEGLLYLYQWKISDLHRIAFFFAFFTTILCGLCKASQSFITSIFGALIFVRSSAFLFYNYIPSVTVNSDATSVTHLHVYVLSVIICFVFGLLVQGNTEGQRQRGTETESKRVSKTDTNSTLSNDSLSI